MGCVQIDHYNEKRKGRRDRETTKEAGEEEVEERGRG